MTEPLDVPTSPYLDSVPPSTSPHITQFKIATVFMIVTLVAVLLAVVVGLAKWIGASPSILLIQSGLPLLLKLPEIVLWSVALTFTLRQIDRNDPARMRLCIVFGGFLLTTVVGQFAMVMLNQVLQKQQVAGQGYWIASLTIWITNAALQAVFWAILLHTLFRRTSLVRVQPADQV